jgi:hypothetical protein
MWIEFKDENNNLLCEIFKNREDIDDYNNNNDDDNENNDCYKSWFCVKK